MFWNRKKKKKEEENAEADELRENIDGKNENTDSDSQDKTVPESLSDQEESTEFGKVSPDFDDKEEAGIEGTAEENSDSDLSSDNHLDSDQDADREDAESVSESASYTEKAYSYSDRDSDIKSQNKDGLSVDERLNETFAEPHEEKKKGFFKRLVSGLGKTRKNISEGFSSLFSGFSELNDDFYEELEEILIMADMGVTTTEEIIDEIKEKAKERKIKSADDCRNLLKEIIAGKLSVSEDAYAFENKKSVVLMVGVNGAGKTTTIGKLASQLKAAGKKVILAAADTFRAAAIDQLQVWADRAGVDIIANKEGTDPASVVYDSISAAKARDADVLICDTAGRLQNKSNLMKELEKINRIIDREYTEAFRETLIVLDATTGQNALAQAKQFSEVTRVTGIVLTKLDGTAKGGIVIAIENELDIPVKYIGVGEGIDDLQKFDPESFTEALFTNEK